MIWTITNNKEWVALEEQFSWVADMKQVDQHKTYHAEGNVAVHTRLVLEKLTGSPEYNALSAQDKEILWAAALLHDVEKRSTSTDNGHGEISSHGHARKGEYTARTVLYRDIPTPFHIREQIVSLVCHHGLPLWLMEKHEPAKKVLEAAFRVNTRHLKILSEADVRGRECQDTDSLLQSLELFELFCKEQDCWGKAKEFATPGARFHYFHTPESYVDYIPFDNFKCNVTLLSGLPGMGKDHYIDSFKEDTPVVSLDNIRRKLKIGPTDKSGNGRVIQLAKEEAKNYLRKGEDFVWNATNITRQMRSQLIDMFVDYGAYVKIVYIEKPFTTWRKQNVNRRFPLPENVLDKMLGKLEVPQITEAHEVEYII